VRILTSDEFDNEVIKSELPVVVDVFADWCGPCRMVGPVFEKLASKWGSSCKFYKLDLEKSRDIAVAFGVSSIPAFLFFSEGKIVGRAVGYKDLLSLEAEMHRFFAL
jgi:thioredoxin